MDKTNDAAVSPTADRELVVSRLIEAPAALVFNAWIQSNQLEQWWGPAGFQTKVQHIDVQPGGSTRIVMEGPDGVEYPNLFTYTEVHAAKLLSYMHSDGSDSDNDAATFGVAVSFDEDANHQTLVTMHSLFKTAAERDRVVREYGAAAGAEQTLERLARFLKDFLPGD